MFDASTSSKPWWTWAFASLALLAAGVALLMATPVLGILTGQRDLSGRAKWVAPERAPLLYGDVDLRQAYAAPLTRWSIQSARGLADRPDLAEALTDAPELWARFVAVQAASTDLDDTDPLFAAVRSINAETEAKGAPVWVQGWIQNGFYLKSYEVVSARSGG